MKQIIKNINLYFDKLVEEYGFRIKYKSDDNQNYTIEYSSEVFVIKLENYFKEFYVSVYKIENSQNEINLFNLLEYLLNDNNAPKSNYYHEEKNMNECYRKQLKHISTIIYNNYELIDSFFKSKNYETNIANLEKYMLNKYPSLFKRT
jgi:hypothetical protein